jgi:hypothetical protein
MPVSRDRPAEKVSGRYQPAGGLFGNLSCSTNGLSPHIRCPDTFPLYSRGQNRVLIADDKLMLTPRGG